MKSALILILLCNCLQTGQKDFISAQKAFIKGLYEEKRHFDCIAETRRLLIHDPSLEKEGGYFILTNYFLGKQYKTVVEHLTEKTGLDMPERLLLAQAYLRLGFFELASHALADLPYPADADAGYDLLLRRAEVHLKGADYGAIQKEIDRYKKFYTGTTKGEGLWGDIARTQPSLRSPALSVAFSALIPGAGQAYAGRFLDAALSLIATLGLGYGTYYSYGHGERPLSYTLGFFTALFYCGNLYGSYNSTLRANSDVAARYATELAERHIPPYHPDPGFLK
jgi:TM2 domain-containing membrane protein YozV